MALFKSKQQREMERKMAVRKARMTLEKMIKSCKNDIEGYIGIAREAHAIGNARQVEIARRAVNKSLKQQRIAESQLINIKIAGQMQNQVEAHKQFSDAMRSVIKSVAESFKMVDMTGLEKDLSETSSKADMLNAQMDMFLETSADAIIGENYEDIGESDSISMDEFQRILGESGAESTPEISDSIKSKLDEVENALKKG